MSGKVRYYANYKDKECYLCGAIPSAKTRDHVIPRCLFPDVWDEPDLITLPACESCNSSYKSDEEYFMNNISAISSLSASAAAKNAWEKTLRSFALGESLQREFRSRIEVREQFTDAGICLGHAKVLKIEIGRVNRVLDKMARGFHAYHTGMRVDPNAGTLAILGSKSAPAELFSLIRFGMVFKDVIHYSGGHRGDLVSFWWMRIWNSIEAVVMISDDIH